MTIAELYDRMDGSYDMALRVMRMDKLIDKHIRKFPDSGIVERLTAAGDSMEPTALFEAAHAMKGVCANLGLTALAELASRITEEFRPGSERALTDDEVKDLLAQVKEQYAKTAAAIKTYAEQ